MKKRKSSKAVVPKTSTDGYECGRNLGPAERARMLAAADRWLNHREPYDEPTPELRKAASERKASEASRQVARLAAEQAASVASGASEVAGPTATDVPSVDEVMVRRFPEGQSCMSRQKPPGRKLMKETHERVKRMYADARTQRADAARDWFENGPEEIAHRKPLYRKPEGE